VLATTRLEAGLKEPLVFLGYSSATDCPPRDSIAAHLISLTAVLLLIWGGGGGDKALSSLSFGQPVVHLVSLGPGDVCKRGSVVSLFPIRCDEISTEC